MMVNLLFYASLLGDSFSPVKKVAKLEKNNHSGTYFTRTSLYLPLPEKIRTIKTISVDIIND